jgi:hypothetical protein
MFLMVSIESWHLWLIGIFVAIGIMIALISASSK